MPGAPGADSIEVLNALSNWRDFPFSGAASIAGMVKLTTAWADFGSQLGFTAQRLGMSASALQTFQGAAALAGSSSSALASGMQTLGQNMWNAVGGRAPEVPLALDLCPACIVRWGRPGREWDPVQRLRCRAAGCPGGRRRLLRPGNLRGLLVGLVNADWLPVVV